MVCSVMIFDQANTFYSAMLGRQLLHVDEIVPYACMQTSCHEGEIGSFRSLAILLILCLLE